MTKNLLLARLKTFVSECRGSMSVEAALALPMMFWCFTAMYSFWDAFKVQNNNLKATYTVADMLSRETGYINQTYVDGLNKVFAYMTNTNYPTKIRVSVVANKLDPSGNEYLELQWSHTANGLVQATDASQLEYLIPVLAVGDQVIVVETFMAHEPIFNLDLHVSCSEESSPGATCSGVNPEDWGSGDFDSRGATESTQWTATVLGNAVVVRPRFVPQVLWQS